ncbi:MAG: hypothetical protein ACW98D_18430 [Promethearchaeota archaeon]
MSESQYLIIRLLVFFLVEKPKSYYDWQQSLKWKKKSEGKKSNSLGIDDSEFKKYLNKWKQKNLH